jgi:hypothetical protein
VKNRKRKKCNREKERDRKVIKREEENQIKRKTEREKSVDM